MIAGHWATPQHVTLFAIIAVLAVCVVVLAVIVWRMRRELRAHTDGCPTLRATAEVAALRARVTDLTELIERRARDDTPDGVELTEPPGDVDNAP